MWDFTDPATLRQMSDGTIAVTNGDPIGRVEDLSGNGWHLTMTTALRRPIWTADGLVCDGIDDALRLNAAPGLVGAEALICMSRSGSAGTATAYV